MNDIKFGAESMPSIIKDPFQKTSVTSLRVWGSNSWGKWCFHGNVEFKNGGTEGKQSFEGESFDEVVLKIKAMLDNLE